MAPEVIFMISTLRNMEKIHGVMAIWETGNAISSLISLNKIAHKIGIVLKELNAVMANYTACHRNDYYDDYWKTNKVNPWGDSKWENRKCNTTFLPKEAECEQHWQCDYGLRCRGNPFSTCNSGQPDPSKENCHDDHIGSPDYDWTWKVLKMKYWFFFINNILFDYSTFIVAGMVALTIIVLFFSSLCVLYVSESRRNNSNSVLANHHSLNSSNSSTP